MSNQRAMCARPKTPGIADMTRVLLVCMANICRSPMARVVAQTLANTEQARPRGLKALFRREAFVFHSAGIQAPTRGEAIDARAQAALLQRGYVPGKVRSRRLKVQDFEHFDMIVAMDQVILAELRRQSPVEHAGKLHLFLDFAPGCRGQDVPDPYYGSPAGFERVLDLCELGAKGLFNELMAQRTSATGA